MVIVKEFFLQYIRLIPHLRVPTFSLLFHIFFIFFFITIIILCTITVCHYNTSLADPCGPLFLFGKIIYYHKYILSILNNNNHIASLHPSLLYKIILHSLQRLTIMHNICQMCILFLSYISNAVRHVRGRPHRSLRNIIINILALISL